MTRRFLDDVRGDLTAQLATGNQTPAPALNLLLLDVIDSTIQDEAVIASNTASPAVPTAIAWAPLTTGIYDVETGGDAEFLKIDLINGSVTTATTGGFTYKIDGNISFDDVASNTPIEFSVLADGVQVGFIAALNGGGSSRPRTASFSHVALSAGADTVFTIGVQTPNGVNTIDIASIALSVTIQPTNNP